MLVETHIFILELQNGSSRKLSMWYAGTLLISEGRIFFLFVEIFLYTVVVRIIFYFFLIVVLI